MIPLDRAVALLSILAASLALILSAAAWPCAARRVVSAVRSAGRVLARRNLR